MSEPMLVCPFCKEDDFDKEGLAHHLKLNCPKFDEAWRSFLNEDLERHQ